MPTQNIYPLSDVDGLQDKVTGIRVEREGEHDLELLWDDSEQEWRLRDQFGEKYVTGDRGQTDITDIEHFVAEQDGEAKLFVESSDEIREEEVISQDNNTLADIAVAENRDLVAVLNAGFTGGDIDVYKKSDLTFVESLTSSSYFSIAFNNQGELAAGASSGDVEIYDVDNNFSLEQTIAAAGSRIEGLDFNLGNRKLAIGVIAGDTLLYEFNASTSNYELTNNVSFTSEFGLEWNQNSGSLGLLNQNEVRVYDSNLNLLDSKSITEGISSSSDIGWRSDNNYVAFLLDDGNGTVRVLDDQLNQVKDLNADSSINNNIDFSPQNRLAIGSSDGNIKVYNNNLNFSFELSMPGSGNVRSIKWLDDSKLFAGDSSSNFVTFSVQRNRVLLDDDTFHDTYETNIVNNGSGIIEIEAQGGVAVNSKVGSQPRLIDKWGEATIRKTKNNGFLVDGDVYEETASGFERDVN